MLPLALAVLQGWVSVPWSQNASACSWLEGLEEKGPFLAGIAVRDGLSPCRHSPRVCWSPVLLPACHPVTLCRDTPAPLTPGLAVPNCHKTCPDATFASLWQLEPGWLWGAVEELGAALGLALP